MILKKTNYLTERIQSMLSESKKEVRKLKSNYIKDYFLKNILEKLKDKIKIILKEELPKV